MNFFEKLKEFFGGILSFFKQNSYHITRQLINQLGIIIFSLVIMFTVNVMPPHLQSTMGVVASIFSIVFYLFLIFYAMRETGNKDSVRIESGRLAYDRTFGLKVGFAASLPNYIFAILMLFGLLLSENLFAVSLTLCNYVLLPMYSGVLTSILWAIPAASRPLIATVAFFIVPALAPIASFLGYTYGVKHPQKETPKR